LFVGSHTAFAPGSISIAIGAALPQGNPEVANRVGTYFGFVTPDPDVEWCHGDAFWEGYPDWQFNDEFLFYAVPETSLRTVPNAKQESTSSTLSTPAYV
jgi:hypothetical protein